MNRILFPIFVLFTLAPCLAAKEGFTFISNKIAVTAKPDATKVTVPYHFENKMDPARCGLGGCGVAVGCGKNRCRFRRF